MTYDVAIIGGGVVGTAIARELSRYHLDVALLERDREVGFGTSKANSGIIHGGAHQDPDELRGYYEWEGNQRWGPLHEQLGFGFRRVGELVVAFDDKDVDHLHKLIEHGDQKGVPGQELWDADRVQREEPNTNPDIIAALWVPTAGVIDPYEATLLLAESAQRNGVALLTEHWVTDLSQDDEGLWTITTSAGEVGARFVINAAGVFSDTIAKMAGANGFEILPRKGEEFLLDKRLSGMVERIIFPCPTPTTKGILVIPTVSGTIMVGPTAEDVDDREDTSTSPEGRAHVFESVRRLVPGISEKDMIASFAGLRAISSTKDFVFGPTDRKGFINVAGIQSPGLTSAPALAEDTAKILADEGLTLREKDDFEPTLPHPVHFREMPLEDKIRLAAEDPHFARLVCRCEIVTEAEITDAIQRGSWTLDGVKFRTRAGMGRCQGGFCTWRVMELIAAERGIDITGVTKRGGDSWIVRPRVEEAPLDDEAATEQEEATR